MNLYSLLEFVKLLYLASNDGKRFVRDLVILESFGDKNADRVKLGDGKGVDLFVFGDFMLEFRAEGGKAS